MMTVIANHFSHALVAVEVGFVCTAHKHNAHWEINMLNLTLSQLVRK